MIRLPKTLMKFYHPDDFELQVDEIEGDGVNQILDDADMGFMAYMSGESSKYDNYPTGNELKCLSRNPEGLAASWGISMSVYNKLLQRD